MTFWTKETMGKGGDCCYLALTLLNMNNLAISLLNMDHLLYLTFSVFVPDLAPQRPRKFCRERAGMSAVDKTRNI